MKLVKIFVLFLLTYSTVSGQMRVSNVNSIDAAVQSLAGDGVVISNVTYDFPSGGTPVGTFQDDFGILGVREGLILTTGSATNASGPNDSGCKSTANNGNEVDSPELESLVERPIYDLVVVEFDVQVSTNLLEFTYVFGSEEYLEFVEGGFSDVFGFFISGPGIDGAQNLAVLPNTQTPVSVSTINNNTNSNYYVNNGTGTTPLVHFDVQYDGFTKPLKAIAEVEACETYHIKLVIGDVNDASCDSGVLLQNASFLAKNIPSLELVYEHDRYAFALEGCNNFDVIVSRGEYDMDRLDVDVNYTFELLGSATVGVDYVMLNQPSDITIPAGEESVSYSFMVNADELTEEDEEIVINVISGCSAFPNVLSLTVPIKEVYEYLITDLSFCGANDMTLNETPPNSDEVKWSSSPYLSCENCSSPVVSNLASSWFYYQAKDLVSGCETEDSVYVKLQPTTASFSFGFEDCYTIHDIKFQNESINGTSYNWSFGDGEASNAENPLHTFGSWEDLEVREEYVVSLVAENADFSCKDSIAISVNIEGELLIPNVITPNGDDKNETFIIKGIYGACWRLSVYNRLGKQIYYNENYQNEWNPSGLSNGVYYYRFQNTAADRTFKGQILITK